MGGILCRFNTLITESSIFKAFDEFEKTFRNFNTDFVISEISELT